MDKIQVFAEIDYEVAVGVDWRESLSEIFKKHAKVLIIAPEFVVNRGALTSLCEIDSRYLFITPEGEGQKVISIVEEIWELLGREEFDRSDAIVAIGGGATTDLAGFVAATWLRGISWYAIPTTLAGMVDASVGGKTGINTAFGKNLVGSFYSPRSVRVDPTWISTLSDRDFSAGLAEVIKTGFIQNMKIVDLLESCSGIPDAREIAEELVILSIAVKAAVVSTDFKEGKYREILNFGHTMGHAVEKNSNFSLRHGEAVSIGLHYEALLSESILGFSSVGTDRLKTLLTKFNLPISINKSEFSWEKVHSLMLSDKKSREGRIRFVGLIAEGQPGWIEQADVGILKEIYERIAI